MTDSDLLGMTEEELRHEILRLRDAIRHHKQAIDQVRNPSKLFRLLPEEKKAETRLPSHQFVEYNVKRKLG